MLFGHRVYCLKKQADLTAEASLYEPSYQYPSSEHGSAYKNYNDGRDAYGKYNKAYGDNGYNHYGGCKKFLRARRVQFEKRTKQCELLSGRTVF